MKGFCELLCWVSTKALSNIRCLTMNTRSNRVVIISSVITRIFFNSVQCWTVTFQPISIKTLVIIYIVHNAHVPVISCIILLLLFNYFVVVRLSFDFCSSFVRLCFPFDSFAFHCSLFKRNIFNSDPGLYSRYFDPVPVVCEVLVQHHHLCKSNTSSYIRLHHL